ncbi:unnamed protein product [Sphagnum balticum]
MNTRVFQESDGDLELHSSKDVSIDTSTPDFFSSIMVVQESVKLMCDEPAKHLQNAQQSLKCASKCSHHKSNCNFRAKLTEYCTDSHSLMMHIRWLFPMTCLLPSHDCLIDQKARKSLKFHNRKEQLGILDSENLLDT